MYNSFMGCGGHSLGKDGKVLKKKVLTKIVWYITEHIIIVI